MSSTTLEASDGTTLHVEWRVPPGPPRAALLVIHGFSAHAGLFDETAQAFVAQGFVVYTYDCRGHGRSSGRRGYVRRFGDFREDMKLVLAELQKRHATLPLILLGHSHGGLIALDGVLHGDARPAALVLLCPYLGLKLTVPWYKRWLVAPLAVLWPTLALGNEIKAEDVVRDAATRARLTADPLIHHVATPRWFREVEATQAAVCAHVADLQTPTWIGLAGEERLVDNDVSLAFARGLGPLATVKTYPGAFHEILQDEVRQEVRTDIATWVVGQLLSPYNSSHS